MALGLGEPVTVGPSPDGVREAIALAAPLLERRPFLLVSDFDGTLAPLSPDPWGATMMPAARRALRSMAGRAGIEVVLLSGRGAADLASRVRVGGATYLGDHGAERATLARRSRATSLETAVQPATSDVGPVVAALVVGVPARVPEPWLVVERKVVTVCFHFRTAPDPASARERVLAACDALDPRGVLERHHGRRSLELRAHGATTKGTALERLLDERRPAAVLALGDDPLDAAGFRVLHGAGADGRPRTVALAVGSHPEWLPDVAPHADGVLRDARATGRFLAALAARAAPRARPLGVLLSRPAGGPSRPPSSSRGFRR